MSNEAPFDGQSAESLEALGKVLRFCSQRVPCKRDDCEKCERREQAWQNAIAQADEEFESQIWGAE